VIIFLQKMRALLCIYLSRDKEQQRVVAKIDCTETEKFLGYLSNKNFNLRRLLTQTFSFRNKNNENKRKRKCE
jgi:hypothetical protein